MDARWKVVERPLGVPRYAVRLPRVSRVRSRLLLPPWSGVGLPTGSTYRAEAASRKATDGYPHRQADTFLCTAHPYRLSSEGRFWWCGSLIPEIPPDPGRPGVRCVCDKSEPFRKQARREAGLVCAFVLDAGLACETGDAAQRPGRSPKSPSTRINDGSTVAPAAPGASGEGVAPPGRLEG